jgi:hypothetical protein
MTGFDVFAVSFCVAFFVASDRFKALFARMMGMIRNT